jgi:hypothetical protein
VLQLECLSHSVEGKCGPRHKSANSTCS